jgi:hypothetical protein
MKWNKFRKIETPPSIFEHVTILRFKTFQKNFSTRFRAAAERRPLMSLIALAAAKSYAG